MAEEAQNHQAQDFYWAIEKDTTKKVAAIHIVKDQRCAYLIASGRAPDSYSGAVALLIWHALQDFATEGIQIFDFEGSSLRGVEGFFRQFGGELRLGLVLRKENLIFRFPELTKRILGK